ncbi:hypothetical protein [Halomonas colorata]|uniref:hypothetical protein n=1 Tax=Halomonas colorata TaxID=2742615 RepID=UPI001868FF94|nr:hypothetical protein [Halomonas colorata]
MTRDVFEVVMRYLRYSLYLFMLMVLALGLLIFSYALYMKYSSTGTDCNNLSHEEIKSTIKGFHDDFPQVFTMSGFRMQGNYEYLDGPSGDFILQVFETDSGYYRAEITCDGGVDVDPWHYER